MAFALLGMSGALRAASTNTALVRTAAELAGDDVLHGDDATGVWHVVAESIAAAAQQPGEVLAVARSVCRHHAPASASARASDSPMPRPAPVTSAVLFWSEKRSSISGMSCRRSVARSSCSTRITPWWMSTWPVTMDWTVSQEPNSAGWPFVLKIIGVDC